MSYRSKGQSPRLNFNSSCFELGYFYKCYCNKRYFNKRIGNKSYFNTYNSEYKQALHQYVRVTDNTGRYCHTSAAPGQLAVLCKLRRAIRVCIELAVPPVFDHTLRTGIGRALLLVSLLILPAVAPADIDDFGNSLDITLYKLASERDDASAQYLIGRKYLRGNSIRKDIGKALLWLKRSAKQGHDKAQLLLGRLYLQGKEVPANRSLAHEYLFKAADSGLDEAQYELGQYYLQGNAGAGNIGKAEKWFALSARQNNSLAQFALGKMYYYGTGVKHDNKKALQYLSIAAESGHNPATELIAKLKHSKTVPDKKLPSAAKRKSGKKGSASTSGSSATQKTLSNAEKFQLGLDYVYAEHGHSKDINKGLALIRSAAEEGYAEAQLLYGTLLAEGKLVDRNYEQAVRWLNKAAKSGAENAKPALRSVRLKLMLSNQDKYVKTAKDQFMIANHYLSGDELPRDDAKAFIWFERAAKRDHVESQYHVGKMYYTGRGIERNLKQAKVWLTKAAAKGMSEAKKMLQNMEFDSTPEAGRENGTTGRQGQLLSVNPAKIESLLGSKLTAQEKTAFKALVKKAQQGDAEAQYSVASRLLSIGTDKTVGKGLEWLTLSANNQNIRAQVRLGSMLLEGTQVDKDVDQAYRWLRAAAEKNDSQAQLMLGDVYKKGLGVKRSNADAIKWYRKSANNGNQEARKRLGGCRVC